MPSETTGLLALHPWVGRRRINRHEYHRMGEVGILAEHDRVELIEGELIEMSPIGSDHSGTVNTLTTMLVRAVGDRGLVAVQNPIVLDDFSEPQPDFSVLKPRADNYRDSHPLPADVLLVIEVAVSSLAYDRAVKRSLYARHGIAEFWIVDRNSRRIEVCRAPTGDRYADLSVVDRTAILEPALLPGVTIAASIILA